MRGHYIIGLHNAIRILRNSWTEVSMLNKLIDASNQSSEAAQRAGGIVFTDTKSTNH